MSYFDAIDYRLPGNDEASFSSHGVVFPKPFMTSIGSEETTAFFLMGQYLKAENGFWYPYIRSLPRPDELTTPLFYSDDDLTWLNMTSLAAAREQRLQIWRANYEKGVACLRELQFEGVDAYSWYIAFFLFLSSPSLGLLKKKKKKEILIFIKGVVSVGIHHHLLARVYCQSASRCHSNGPARRRQNIRSSPHG
jgi:hypothetical protein